MKKWTHVTINVGLLLKELALMKDTDEVILDFETDYDGNSVTKMGYLTGCVGLPERNRIILTGGDNEHYKPYKQFKG